MEIFLVKGLAEGAHFIRGIYDGRREDMDGAVGNSLMQQEQAVVKFLAGIRKRIIFRAWRQVRRNRRARFGRIALVVKAGGFEGAGGHAAAEDGDGGGFLRRIFVVEPAAQIQEGEHEEKKKRADDSKK